MARKKILYLGLKVPNSFSEENVIHYPIIKTIARSADDPAIAKAFQQFDHYTDIAMTSKVAVEIYKSYLKAFLINRFKAKNKRHYAVGHATAATLKNIGFTASFPQEETAEGLCTLIEKENYNDRHFLWLHSSLSRDTLPTFFSRKGIACCSCIAYETVVNVPQPPAAIEINEVDEIFFTSPSTVDAFIELFGALPQEKKLTPIGPITAIKLRGCLQSK